MNVGNYLRILEREYGFTLNDEYYSFMDFLSSDEMYHEETMQVTEHFKEKTVIGIYTKYKNDILFAYSISSFSFFNYPYKDILNYLLFSSFFGIKRKYRKIEILKLVYVNENEPLTVICKTYWLRIIQRHWKRLYEERQWILESRRTLHSLRYFELRGRYPTGLNSLPTLYGMLSIYTKQNHQTLTQC